MKKLLVCFFVALGIALFPVIAGAQQNQKKYALVIGNQDYTKFGRLNKTRTDANDMETALRSIGFTVDKVLDGNLIQMQNALTRLRNRLGESKDTIGFFYYSGHGAQNRRGDENYLIPSDADIPSESYVSQRALSLQTVHEEMSSAGNQLNIIVLDACRNFPATWSKSGAKGLSPVTYRLVNSLIVYATTPGEVAVEDSTGKNSLYTEHLLKYLTNPDLHVNEMFRRVNADVVKASRQEQIPQVNGQYFGTAVLNPRKGGQPAPEPTPAVTPTPAPAPAVTTNIPANMVRVEGGTFTMGSPANEPGRDSGEVQHQVTVSSFYMGKYEVTQKEYQEVMGTNPSRFKGDNLPVENVSWFDAVEYCNKRSIKEGLTPAYSGSGNNITCNWNANGYRLPTEAEWEYAAKGGNRDTMVYEYSGSNSVDSVAWYGGNSGDSTKPVGTKAPNSLGLYDMSGNVVEWCWDWYGSYSSGSQTDPRGASSGSYRVARGGGGWYYSAEYVRSAYRGSSNPNDRFSIMGFRLVRN